MLLVSIMFLTQNYIFCVTFYANFIREKYNNLKKFIVKFYMILFATIFFLGLKNILCLGYIHHKIGIDFSLLILKNVKRDIFRCDVSIFNFKLFSKYISKCNFH